MTLFDKVLINLHKGAEKLKWGAAIFSERIKFELGIIRMRIRINSIRERINELYAQIGRRAAALSAANAEQLRAPLAEFLKSDEVAAALEEIEKLLKEIDEITADLAREQEDAVGDLKEPGEKKV